VSPPTTTYTSTRDGAHTHGMPSAWYNRNLSCGKWASVDTNAQPKDQWQTQSAGVHDHRVTVAIPGFTSGVNQQTALPPWYAAAYLMKLGV
jgi:hypothetical protein